MPLWKLSMTFVRFISVYLLRINRTEIILHDDSFCLLIYNNGFNNNGELYNLLFEEYKLFTELIMEYSIFSLNNKIKIK